MTDPQVIIIPYIEWHFPTCVGVLQQCIDALADPVVEDPVVSHMEFVLRHFAFARSQTANNDGPVDFDIASPQIPWDERLRQPDTLYSLDMIDVAEHLVDRFEQLGPRSSKFAYYIICKLLLYYSVERCNIFPKMYGSARRGTGAYRNAQLLNARMHTYREDLARGPLDRSQELQIRMEADLTAYLAEFGEVLPCGRDIVSFLAEFSRMRELQQRAHTVATT